MVYAESKWLKLYDHVFLASVNFKWAVSRNHGFLFLLFYLSPRVTLFVFIARDSAVFKHPFHKRTRLSSEGHLSPWALLSCWEEDSFWRPRYPLPFISPVKRGVLNSLTRPGIGKGTKPMVIHAMGWTSCKQEIRRQRVMSSTRGSEQGHGFLPRQHCKEFVLVLG